MSEQTIETWGIVELMGHVRLSGRLSEENHFGSVLGRIDIPQLDGSMVTQYFSGSSVFRITPTSEQIARDIALSDKPKPIQVWELRNFLPANTSLRNNDGSEIDYNDDVDDVDDDDGDESAF